MSPIRIIEDELRRVRDQAASLMEAFVAGAMGPAAYQQSMERLNVEVELLDRLLDEFAREAAHA